MLLFFYFTKIPSGRKTFMKFAAKFGPTRSLYNGIAETSGNKAYVYSINGVSEETNGLGNLALPFNSAGAKAAIDAKFTGNAFVKGKISKVANNGYFGAQYGNATFTMIVSIISMWVFRVGMSYIFARTQILGLVRVMNWDDCYGAVGTWLSMNIDWAVRSAFFIGRFISGKWKNASVI